MPLLICVLTRVGMNNDGQPEALGRIFLDNEGPKYAVDGAKLGVTRHSDKSFVAEFKGESAKGITGEVGNTARLDCNSPEVSSMWVGLLKHYLMEQTSRTRNRQK